MVNERGRTDAPSRLLKTGVHTLILAVLCAARLAEADSATVSTDKLDYPPGQTVVITGSGWAPGEAVSLLLERDPLTHANQVFFSLADSGGSLSDSEYVVQSYDLGVTFTLTATGLTSGNVARATFTDGSCGDGAVNSSGEECDEGAANGSASSCCNANCKLKSAGTVCRASAGTCDVAETCDGVGNSCPADGFQSASVVCRAAAGECDVAESCPGNGPNCPADAKKASGTLCTDDGNPCTTDT